MGTHIIWRNPSPPRKRGLQVARITRNQIGAIYQAAAPSGFNRLFQVIRAKQAAPPIIAARTSAAMAAVMPGARLVLARWQTTAESGRRQHTVHSARGILHTGQLLRTVHFAVPAH